MFESPAVHDGPVSRVPGNRYNQGLRCNAHLTCPRLLPRGTVRDSLPALAARPGRDQHNGMKGMWCPAWPGTRRHGVRVVASRPRSCSSDGRAVP